VSVGIAKYPLNEAFSTERGLSIGNFGVVCLFSLTGLLLSAVAIASFGFAQVGAALQLVY